MKEVKWKDILDKFLEFKEEELSLPVIIGGGDVLYRFTGFESIWPTKPSKALTGKEVLDVLLNLPEITLNSIVDRNLEFEDKFGIGISKVAISYSYWRDDKGDGIFDEEELFIPQQDYLGKEYGTLPDIETVHNNFNEEARSYKACHWEPKEHKLLDAGSVIVIEVWDGSCLLDDKDLLIIF